MPKNIPEAEFETLLKRIRVSLSDADLYTRRNQRLVSYTHLDVYKRQTKEYATPPGCVLFCNLLINVSHAR